MYTSWFFALSLPSAFCGLRLPLLSACAHLAAFKCDKLRSVLRAGASSLRPGLRSAVGIRVMVVIVALVVVAVCVANFSVAFCFQAFAFQWPRFVNQRSRSTKVAGSGRQQTPW